MLAVSIIGLFVLDSTTSAMIQWHLHSIEDKWQLDACCLTGRAAVMQKLESARFNVVDGESLILVRGRRRTEPAENAHTTQPQNTRESRRARTNSKAPPQPPSPQTNQRTAPNAAQTAPPTTAPAQPTTRTQDLRTKCFQPHREHNRRRREHASVVSSPLCERSSLLSFSSNSSNHSGRRGADVRPPQTFLTPQPSLCQVLDEC